MSGVKGKSGRRKKTMTTANAHRRLQQLLPIAIEVIGETAEGVNRDRLRYESAIEIKDSVLGKPKAQVDMDLGGGELLGAGVVAQIFQIMAQERRKQLGEGRDAIQE